MIKITHEMKSQITGCFNILSFGTNGWDVLFSHLGIKDPTDKATWKLALKRPGLGYKYLTQILALAYWDSQSDCPYDLQGIKDLCKELGINYFAATTGHKNELRNELAMLGDERVRLIERGDTAFYLRTIAHLSGSRYVQFAKSLKSVLSHASIDEMKDENRFHELLHTYGTADVKQVLHSEEGEEKESNDETLAFLWKMLKIFQRTGHAPTVEDVHEVALVSLPICERIVKELTDAIREDCLPEIAFDEDGRAVFSLPEDPEFDGNPEKVIFRFFNESPLISKPICRCIYDGHFWSSLPSPNYAVAGFPAEGIKSVQKRIIRADNASEFVEMVGRLSSDGEGRFALVRVIPDHGRICGYKEAMGRSFVRRADRLRLGECYRIVSLGDSHPSVRVNTAENENGVDLPADVFAAAYGRCFKVPFDALSIKVGGVEFAVENGFAQWLAAERDRITCVENKGSRIFINATTFPLFQFAALPSDVTVSYEYDSQCELLLCQGSVIPAYWEAPAQILWKKGKLSIRSDGDEKVWRCPMTFVDVDFSALDHIFDEGEAGRVNVRLGEKNLTLDFSGNDVELGGLEYGGFKFRPKIRRQGVMLHAAGKDIVIPRSTGMESKLYVALKDFDQGDKARNVMITSPQSDSFEFVQGNRRVNVGENQTYVVRGAVSGSSLLGNPLEFLPGDFQRCRFELVKSNGGVDPYPFRLYDPKATPMPRSGQGKSFLFEHDNANPSDLLVSYFVSYTDYYSDRERVLACYPAHRQDDMPILIPVDSRFCKTDEFGRLIETITVKGFYDRDVPNGWGWGLICFSAMKKSGENDEARYEALSVGFFVARPDGKSPLIDDVYGLRTALAATSVRNANGEATDEQRECLKRIEDIMSSESSEVRDAIRTYIPRAIAAADKVNVFGSLNSFRNEIVDANGDLVWVSGYLFMAGWYLKETLAENEDELPVYLRPYWHRALIGYAEAEKTISDVDLCYFKNQFSPAIEKLVLRFLNDLDDEYINWWFQENGNEAGFPPSLSKATLLKIERFVNRYVRKEFGQQGQECRFSTIGAYGRWDVHSFSYKRFLSLLELTARWLHCWRKHPSLYEALGRDAEGRAICVQELREILHLLDAIDHEVSQSVVLQGGMRQITKARPVMFLVEGISLTYKMKEESQSNKGENE